MALLGIDIGTTHCKAGVLGDDHTKFFTTSRPTPVRYSREGNAYYDPEELWRCVLDLIEGCTRGAGNGSIAAVGIASMFETGLLVDRRTGNARSPLIPWFDKAASPQAATISERAEERQIYFSRFGIYPSFRCSLSKILWLRDMSPELLDEHSVWLSAAGFIAWKLSGALATDFSLSGRTYAFNLSSRSWDLPWIESFGLPSSLFPEAVPAGQVIGVIGGPESRQAGLKDGTPVTIAGHDHVCAAFGAGIRKPGDALDSMGTAEVLIGAMAEKALGPGEYASGLTFGIMPGTSTMYWLGGLSASGGSIEWLRAILGDVPPSFEELDSLMEDSGGGPGTVLYFPYLSGSGAPMPNPNARGAFLGLDARHTRGDLVKSVLVGTACQMESIRRAAGEMAGMEIERIVAAGGGSKNRRWLQIKSNTYGVPIRKLNVAEATLFGAAMLAGRGTNTFGDSAGDPAGLEYEIVNPDERESKDYRRMYEERYSVMMKNIAGHA